MDHGLELAKGLVRSVVRAFYDQREIIVVECIVIHHALRDDDLQVLTTFTLKDLHKLCSKLNDDRLISIFHRNEVKDGQQRAQSRTYYYIDYRQAIDAIKWRVFTIDKDIQGVAVVPLEKKEWFCPHCKAQWTQMEVLDKWSPEGFRCHTCDSVLKQDLELTSTGHEQSTRLNNQFKFITDVLPQIDAIRIPDNSFEVALSNARPVMRDATNPAIASVVVDSGVKRPTAVHGLQNTGPKTMSVSISASDGPSEAEKAAEKARREKIAQQNALPSWMSNSTVTGESFSAVPVGPAAALGYQADVKDSTLKQSAGETENADIDDLFARLKEQQAADAARGEMEEDEDGSDEDEDEGDFEDIVASVGNSNTPVSTAPVPKRASDESEDSEERTAKKVKTEVETEAPSNNADDGGESEEDVEFEDV